MHCSQPQPKRWSEQLLSASASSELRSQQQISGAAAHLNLLRKAMQGKDKLVQNGKRLLHNVSMKEVIEIKKNAQKCELSIVLIT